VHSRITSATARALTAGQRAPVYRYVFSQGLREGPLALLGAFHTSELFFVFGTIGLLTGGRVNAEDRALSGAIMGYWGRFAATGDPNGVGAPAWPRYAAAPDPYLELRTPIISGAGYRTARCDAIARILPGRG